MQYKEYIEDTVDAYFKDMSHPELIENWMRDSEYEHTGNIPDATVEEIIARIITRLDAINL